MKTFVRPLILCLPILLIFSNLNASINGSRSLKTSSFDYRDFSKISISNAIDVTIVQSNEFGVEITYNDNLEEYLQVNKKGDQLVIKLKSGKTYKNVDIKAVIKMPEVTSLIASGASSINNELIKGEELKINVSGASDITANLELQKLTADASGASDIKLAGVVKDFDCGTSGASDLKASKLVVNNILRLTGSGASNMSITCNGEMAIRLSGASDLVYYGTGKIVNQSTSGASSIKSK